MDFEKAKDVCRSFPGATQDIKWGADVVFSVGDKMFMVTGTGASPGMSFKVEDERFLELTDRPGIIPAPYLARARWVRVESADALDEREAAALLRRSYELVFAKLTRKLQRALGGTGMTLDELETRDPIHRERDLMARLPQLIARAQQAPGWARILDGVDAGSVTSRDALAALPITRKSDLKALQQRDLPFGGLAVTPARQLRHVYVSPGPIYDPEGRGRDWWRFARPMYAAGVRPGGLLQNCFSYHFTPAAFMVEGGAARIGCAVIPAGAGQTEMQVQAMADLRPDTYVGTPSFLRIIIEKAREMGADISSVQYALMGAEALPESLRAWFRENGVPHVFQTYASADVGSIAYETANAGVLDPGMVVDEDVIVEIVRPGSGEPVEPGDIGEIVVTLFNHDYPLIRFATGDMSALLVAPAATQCGRTNVRIKGWMGRADQTTKVRAMFVHPAQVVNIARRHPEIVKARLVVSGRMANDVMTLHCEVAHPLSTDRIDAIVASIRDVTKLRAEVRLETPGSLPDDGKMIEDRRDYS